MDSRTWSPHPDMMYGPTTHRTRTCSFGKFIFRPSPACLGKRSLLLLQHIVPLQTPANSPCPRFVKPDPHSESHPGLCYKAQKIPQQSTMHNSAGSLYLHQPQMNYLIKMVYFGVVPLTHTIDLKSSTGSEGAAAELLLA